MVTRVRSENAVCCADGTRDRRDVMLRIKLLRGGGSSRRRNSRLNATYSAGVTFQYYPASKITESDNYKNYSSRSFAAGKRLERGRES